MHASERVRDIREIGQMGWQTDFTSFNDGVWMTTENLGPQ